MADMHVTVVGSGTIGSTAAYTLANARPELDITLADVDVDFAEGHAIDMWHARCHAGHPVGTNPDLDPDVLGSVEHAEPGPKAIADADVVLVTASAPRPADSAQRGGRIQFLEANREIVREIGSWFREVAPRPVVVVTNPMDLIAHELWQRSGWPREYVVGYSLSETARMADWIATREGVSPAAVDCPMLGEHGEHLVPAFSRATVDGEPLEIDPDERDEALDFVRQAPYDVTERRGAEQSSRWVSARGVALLAERVLDGGMDDPICLGVPLDGEYGFEGITMSVPVRLGGDGWTEIVDWELSAWERERLEEAAASIAESL